MSRKLSIGLVCPYNIFRGGGVQECVIAMQSELIKRGHTVFIITPTPKESGTPPPNTLMLGGATQIKTFHTTSDISVSANADERQETLDHHTFDILHFHEPWIPVLSRQILNKSNAINVATFHAKLPDTAMSKTLEKVITPYTKSILKYLDARTAVSDAAMDYVSSLTTQHVEIIPNGIDLKKYKNTGQKRLEQTILYIGRLEKRKGVKHLLRAFAHVNNALPNAKLLIAGDGPDRQKLEEYVAQKKITNVEFLGYVSESKKLKLLQQATLFCSPALYGESFGIVLLEAMACGTPIVAGDNPGYSAVLKDRGKLSLVDPKDEQEFARRLELFLTDQELRQLWSKWSLEYVKQFDYVKVVDQYEALYQRLVKEHAQ